MIASVQPIFCNPCLGHDTYYGLNRISLQRGMKCTARTKAAVPAGRDRVC